MQKNNNNIATTPEVQTFCFEGYENFRHLAHRLDADEKGVYIMAPLGGHQKITVINEVISTVKEVYHAF